MIAIEGRSLSSPLKKPDSPPPPPPPFPPPWPLILLLIRSFLEVESDLVLRMDDRRLSLNFAKTSAAVFPPAYMSALPPGAGASVGADDGFKSPCFLFDEVFRELSASVESLRLKSRKSPGIFSVKGERGSAYETSKICVFSLLHCAYRQGSHRHHPHRQSHLYCSQTQPVEEFWVSFVSSVMKMKT